MNNTALGAENKKEQTINFISEAHEKLKEVRYQDVYHKALCYCLGISDDTRRNVDSIYDFKTGCVKTECLHEGWQTSGSMKVVRMAFNLYCNGTPSVDDYAKTEEQVNECRQYTVEDLFCCAYAPFFWPAIQIRYPEYATYNRELYALFGGAADFEELLKLLQEYGCEVSKRGKSYRLKLSGWEKAARMDSLGEGYGLEDLRAVLLGKKAHTPRKKTVTQAEPPKVNLLVDIQAKLQAGKGAGYARWAKVFNLKQMAQTMNYLSENNLLEYAVLEEKAAAATAHHNDLSAQIKAAEKRMAEIAVLCTHIVNYAKTREVYVAYRKAGYSKKFREEHEEEILLHQAAKNAFDEMGVKKLPKVKELQTEYAKLLEEKKKTYAEYRHSREEMRELLTAKANVDRVLKMEVEQDVEKEKDHGQR
jgi:hypothetical protein